MHGRQPQRTLRGPYPYCCRRQKVARTWQLCSMPSGGGRFFSSKARADHAGYVGRHIRGLANPPRFSVLRKCFQSTVGSRSKTLSSPCGGPLPGLPLCLSSVFLLAEPSKPIYITRLTTWQGPIRSRRSCFSTPCIYLNQALHHSADHFARSYRKLLLHLSPSQ